MTKPDETKVTVGPFNSFFADTTGYFTYAPDQLGPTGQYNLTSPAAISLQEIIHRRHQRR